MVKKLLKLSAAFATAALVSGCLEEPQPVRVEKKEIEGGAHDRVVRPFFRDPSNVSVEHQVLLIRKGCEVSYTKVFSTKGNNIGDTHLTSVCPPPGVEAKQDAIGKGVEYQLLHTTYGCDIGTLFLNGRSKGTIVLCPATGESQVRHTETTVTGKTTTSKEIAVDQHRPKQ